MAAKLIKTFKDPNLGIIEVWVDPRLTRVHLDQGGMRRRLMIPDESVLDFILQKLGLSQKPQLSPKVQTPSPAKESYIEDYEFGRIKVITSARRGASVAFGFVDGNLVLTRGASITTDDLKRAINESREKIRRVMCGQPADSSVSQNYEVITDVEFGEVKVFLSSRRGASMVTKVVDGHLEVTRGSRFSMDMVRKVIDDRRAALRNLLNKDAQKIRPPKIYDENTVFTTLTFSLKIFRHRLSRLMASKEGDVLKIMVPEQADIQAPSVQDFIRKALVSAMTHDAKILLPRKLTMLAQQNNFNFTEVSIRSTHSQWGSCTATRHISLSCFLMLLPEHLIDYVLLHELCHTREMNHGPHFHQLLNQACGGHDTEYDKALSHYTPAV